MKKKTEWLKETHIHVYKVPNIYIYWLFREKKTTLKPTLLYYIKRFLCVNERTTDRTNECTNDWTTESVSSFHSNRITFDENLLFLELQPWVINHIRSPGGGRSAVVSTFYMCFPWTASNKFALHNSSVRWIKFVACIHFTRCRCCLVFCSTI